MPQSLGSRSRDRRWRGCLRHYAISCRSRARFPVGVIEIFLWFIPSGRPMARGRLGQLHKRVQGIYPEGKRRPYLITFTCQLPRDSGSHNFLEHERPVPISIGTASAAVSDTSHAAYKRQCL